MITIQVCKELKAVRRETPKLGRELTPVERLALAFASTTIHRLPPELQEWSNAYDMQSILVGKSCGWDGHLLGQALRMLEVLTGRPRENLGAVVKITGIREDVERLVTAAIEEHRQEEAEVARLVDEAKAA